MVVDVSLLLDLCGELLAAEAARDQTLERPTMLFEGNSLVVSRCEDLLGLVEGLFRDVGLMIPDVPSAVPLELPVVNPIREHSMHGAWIEVRTSCIEEGCIFTEFV